MEKILKKLEGCYLLCSSRVQRNLIIELKQDFKALQKENEELKELSKCQCGNDSTINICDSCLTIMVAEGN